MVYAYLFKDCRIKMWIATVNAVDSGRRGPWPGSHTSEEPAWALLQLGLFMELRIQGATEMFQLESETPPLPAMLRALEFPDWMGTSWALLVSYLLTADCGTCMHSHIWGQRLTDSRSECARGDWKVHEYVYETWHGTGRGQDLGADPHYTWLPDVDDFYQKFLWNHENQLLQPVLKYYYICGKTE